MGDEIEHMIDRFHSGEVLAPVVDHLVGANGPHEIKLAGVVDAASKNEVIIAGLLDQLVPGRWSYEQPLTGGDGRTVHPDFTIVIDDGRTVYWEHAGMLDLPDYARKWDLKQTWYAENGVVRHDAGHGPDGILLVTDDRRGANAQAWLELASQVLGLEASAAGPGGSARRSPTKRRRDADCCRHRPRRGVPGVGHPATPASGS